jgi:hypothetical protein
MPEPSKGDARALIESALASLLDPQQDTEGLSRYFAPDYVQVSTGSASTSTVSSITPAPLRRLFAGRTVRARLVGRRRGALAAPPRGGDPPAPYLVCKLAT